MPWPPRPSCIGSSRRSSGRGQRNRWCASRSTPGRPTSVTGTVLFACVPNLGPAGEGLDPEAQRRVGARCLDDMRGVLERHGGAVQQFPGDTLMAIYGVPRLHEDDAARAVRAALELRETVASVGVRIGVGTGDVIVESDEGDRPSATGDAVNLAK